MKNFVANEEASHDFCEAIKTIASKSENMENLEYYLGAHFDTCLRALQTLRKTLQQS